MTDDDRTPVAGTDRGSARRFGRVLGRRLGAGLALAGAVGLAGCGALQGGEGGPNGGRTGDDPSGDGRSSDGSGSGDGSTASCEERLMELEDRRGELLLDEDGFGTFRASNVRTLELLTEQLRDGFDADTVERANALARTVRESVVVVSVARDGRHLGEGTGWFATPERLVTNAHVVLEGDLPGNEVTCYTHDGSSFEADIVDYVEMATPDVAVLETRGTTGPPLSLGTVQDLTERQPVLQVGHPGGVGNWVASMGMYVDKEENPMDISHYNVSTTIPGEQGVSGSPVVDLDGTVVALTWGADPPYSKSFGDRPMVSPDVVFDSPLSPIGVTQHVDVDVVARLLERW